MDIKNDHADDLQNEFTDDSNHNEGEFVGEEKALLYQYRKYNETKHIRSKRGWKAYSKVNNLSTKIKKLSKLQ